MRLIASSPGRHLLLLGARGSTFSRRPGDFRGSNHRGPAMQYKFEELEIAMVPGVLWYGVADITWDEIADCYCVETIGFAPEKIATSNRNYTRKAMKFLGLDLLWDQLEEAILESAEASGELEERPIERNEHAFTKHEYGLR